MSKVNNENNKYKRVFTIVIDSMGIGNGKDAAAFGDEGADTFGHIEEAAGPLNIPNLEKLGLLALHPAEKQPSDVTPEGYRIRLNEAGCSKDTMGGHWEMTGLKTVTPFKTFTDTGFPKELMDALEQATGHKAIGNKSASGTEILDELGEEQIRDNSMIVYTSADSVLQIAANEDSFGLDELYRCCEIARELTMKDEWKVGRVIARPYVGTKAGRFRRTPNRHDYALQPFGKTALDALKEAGYEVISVGKIYDIFDGCGLTESNKSQSSVHGMEQTNEIAERDFTGLCFTNLVDFDALWGHRRDPEGYGKEIEKFDIGLGELLESSTTTIS